MVDPEEPRRPRGGTPAQAARSSHAEAEQHADEDLERPARDCREHETDRHGWAPERMEEDGRRPAPPEGRPTWRR